ncbi:hypothetical protein [Thioalkalivibrio sp.]|uniref:hypothetical protein n=1 Tax=Thioalkalivibrio sp. TaxID=2093813 RepID=UPI00397486ED
MESYDFTHELAGIYADKDAAQKAYQAFIEAGFDASEVRLITPDQAPEDSDAVSQDIEPESGGTRDQIVKDTVAGTAAGGTAGAVGAGAIGLMAPMLFAAAPVVAPLIVMGYGAAIGGMAGAITGLHVEKTRLAGIVEDALKGGFWVVLVHGRDEAAYRKASEVMESTVVERSISG